LLLSFIAGHFTADRSATASSSQRAAFVMDDQAGAFRFLIDGKPVASIDAKGLNVRADIGYGGSLTDYGSRGFDKHTAEVGNAR
jgi:hypothetical protein